MRTKSFLGAMAALLLVGCGGGGSGTTVRGEVSGVVFDADGKPVRGALVYIDTGGHRETFTDSAGSYILRDVSAEDLLVRAQTTADGNIRFVGQNLARVFGNERERSANITLVAETSQSRIVGVVTTANGRVAKGLRVVVRPTDGKTLSSSSTLTDNDGVYSIDGLIRGVEYQVLANGNGFGEDSRLITTDGREVQQNLTLGTASNPALNPPANLDAVAYTTPGDVTTRSARQASAYESVKQLLDPKRAARLAKRKATRDTTLGRPIEVDLFWDDYTTIDTVGYGVYRRLGASGADTPTFLQDPLAAYFADADSALLPATTYSYAITAINSSYNGNTGAGESDFSNRVSVTPLPDLTGTRLTGSTLQWNAVAGATNYTVFIYNQYPGLGVAPVNGSTGQTVTTTSLSVSSLAFGSYYYVVVGERADGSARTLSLIDTFTIASI